MLYSSDSRIYPVNKLTAVVDAMSAEGIPVDLALQGTGVSAQELKSPETRLAVSQLLAAYRNALMHALRSRFAWEGTLTSRPTASMVMRF